MLQRLHIRDFVIVDTLELAFEGDLTVFSGETGAGKSILIDALSLALGARSDAGVVRPGAQRADISAVFSVAPHLEAWLDAQAIDSDEDIMLRRSIDTQGRSRAFINGVPATLGQLRALGEQLVDIHGQHAHQSLLQAGHQRALLDAQGAHLALAQQVQAAWQDWQAAVRALEQARQQAEARRQDSERLQWQHDELERLGLGDDEWARLTTEHRRLAHAQALLDGGAQALAALDTEDSGARRHLLLARNALEPLLRHDDRLTEIHDSVASALIACDSAISDLNAYLSRFELDPAALEQAEQRMAAIFELARKLHAEPEQLPALQAALQQKLQELQAAGDLERLQAAVDTCRKHYDHCAADLSARRRETATRLAAQVSAAMQTLAMEGGQFDIELSPAQAGPHGNESIAFLVAGHAGTPPRPLAKVASGGELARISLALSVIASQAARVPTLIFDEVDAGIGGAVAEVVGRLLRELGARHQVLCVTHLPQVAACGRQHWAVRKQRAPDGTTVSRINALDPAARIEEIARMLGGLTITETTRRHAAEMLKQNQAGMSTGAGTGTGTAR